jgi:hypothetical protein
MHSNPPMNPCGLSFEKPQAGSHQRLLRASLLTTVSKYDVNVNYEQESQ